MTGLQLAVDHPDVVRRLAVFPVELIEATARGIPDSRWVHLPGRGHITALFDRRGSQAIAEFLRDA